MLRLLEMAIWNEQRVEVSTSDFCEQPMHPTDLIPNHHGAIRERLEIVHSSGQFYSRFLH
jgi:hypothetical protein